MTYLSKLILLIGLVLGVAACAPPADQDVTSHARGIVDGTLDTGHEAVVLMTSTGGSGCTATIIAPRVVLLARHCVEPPGRAQIPAAQIIIRSGVNAGTSPVNTYSVSEVRAVTGAGLSAVGGAPGPNEVAVLILSSDARETPMALSRRAPTELLGPTTAVGFGLRRGAGVDGNKYTVGSNVINFDGNYFFVEPSICQGDSGGPLLDAEGNIWGVASFVFPEPGIGATQPVCGRDQGAYNAIYQHLDLIDQALRDTGACSEDAVELCNGIDDNCDGEIDEGCIALGGTCTTDEECVGGACADAPSGRVCAQPCDGLRPNEGCAAGFYCASATGSCQGACVMGTAGSTPIGADCSADTECASLRCLDPGDGRSRCLQVCAGDQGLCLDGEVCAASVGSCGGCVDASLLSSGRGLGEPCAEDQCRADLTCTEVSGLSECASPCAGPADCGSGFECRDSFCITDRRGPEGSTCLENSDCIDSTCAAQGERMWCTAQCSSGADCPSGFECAPSGGTMVCAPILALEGETCTANGDCTTGICAGIDGALVCTSICGPQNLCLRGNECVRTADGLSAVCVPASEEGGGCSVRPQAAGQGGWLWMWVAAGLLLWRRRQDSIDRR